MVPHPTLFSLYRTKGVWLLEHLLFIMVPLAVITSHPENKLLGYGVALVAFVLSASVAVWFGATPGTLGLTTTHLGAALRALLVPTVLLALLIGLGRLLVPQAYVVRAASRTILVQYVVISVPLQELLFRGLCLWRCRLSFHSTAFVLLFNAADFAAYHVLFGNGWLVSGVFLVSLLWSGVFLRHRNLYAVILSHAVLGALYFGFV